MNESETLRSLGDRLMRRLEPVAQAGNNSPLTATHLHRLTGLADEIARRFPGPSESAPGALVLFSGAGCTGKTVAAQVLAEKLGRDLFRVDLAEVVGKYIGETEKNLSIVFDSAAARSNPILFFDEGDALFGKRTDVKDSNDRYAGIEINYLLQRAQAYPGLVILACNQAIPTNDAINHVVDFPA